MANKNKSNKSIYVPFTLKITDLSTIYFQGTQNPSSDVKYLSITFDKRLTWGLHLELKKNTLYS
jgi:hypothetical protein